MGLLAWSPQAIRFLPHGEVLRESLAQEGYRTLRAQLAPGLSWVPVPRRVPRWLAQQGQPGLIATACGVLLRCMRYKARQCVTGGRVAGGAVPGSEAGRSDVDPQRWDHAQVALAQWQKQQYKARCPRSGMEALGTAPDKESEADDTSADTAR